ncbi:hypothetical protein [Kosakonia pseudosacchari]|uniref:hypothetical protein n=1 Tax=Kosakonia pseudosacchari TaxID=1646340 RepID=UPI0011446328|nr:hypothetical protein [Kosakonia pseudosacchari]
MTDKIIVFSGANGVSVIFPANCGLSLLDIGRKDVPPGVPFWTIDKTEMPDTPQSTWEMGSEAFGEPAGYGGTYTYVEACE